MIEEDAAILAPPAGEATYSVTPFVPPAGSPAAAETSDVVIATLRQLFALANARDPLRIARLYTDDFMRDFSGGVPREDLFDFPATPPQAMPDDQKRVIVHMGEVQLLPDVRVGVAIVLDEPDDPRTVELDFVMLERVEGRWLVDEIYEDASATGMQATGTPAAYIRGASNGLLSSLRAFSCPRFHARR